MKKIISPILILLVTILFPSCNSHPFNPMAEDLADKWEDIWDIVKEYEGLNTMALMKEKLNIENGDREKVWQYGKDFDDILLKSGKEMEGKEVKVEVISGYRDLMINKPWKIERIDPIGPRITIKGDMEVVCTTDNRNLYLVGFAGKEPVCVFRTTGYIISDKELVNGRPAIGSILTYTERSPEIPQYHWKKIAEIDRLIWIYEDSEDFRNADRAMERDLKFEERLNSIKIE
mgnify:FL=1